MLISLLIGLATAIPAQAEPACLLCSTTAPHTVPAHMIKDACEDLFATACVDGGGIDRQKKTKEDLEARLKQLVSNARQAGLTAMGYSSEQDAVRKELLKLGIEIKPELSAKAQKYLFENDYTSYVDGKEIFVNVQKCEEEKAKLANSWSSDANVIKTEITAHQAFVNQWKEQQIKTFANAIPQFLESLSSKCSSVKSLTDEQKAKPSAQTVVEFCKNSPAVRRKAIDLFRRSSTPGYVEESTKFVREHIDVLTADIYSYSSETTATDEVSQLRAELNRISSTATQLCSNLGQPLTSIAQGRRRETLSLVGRMRPTIETLIESHYNSTYKQKVDALFVRVKAEAKALISKIVSDQMLKNEVLRQYDRLQLGWLVKPTDEKYVRNAMYSVDLLDITSVNEFSPLEGAFLDPDLTFFTQMNAFYMPAISMGAKVSEANVNMMPAFIQSLDRNTFSFLEVLSHEVGHQVGPMVSVINGHDLRATHGPVLACFSSPDSINLQVGQGDESIADMVSASIMGKLIAELPPEKRLDAAAATVEAYCLFEQDDQDSLAIHADAGHPNPILRTSGIFGGNKLFRKAMGCEADSQKFKTCSWPGEQ